MRSTLRRELLVLDFDIENRPLSYLAQDWTSAEITAIAWSWNGDEKVSTLLLTAEGTYKDDRGRHFKPKDGLAYFREYLCTADVVTGHYIRKHDLPILNAAFMEYGVPALPQLVVSDTKTDLVRRKDLSVSQENLSALLGLPEPKHHMTQTEWREANRLFTNAKLRLSRDRVVGDVVQHKAMRAELVRRGLLKPARAWRS